MHIDVPPHIPTNCSFYLGNINRTPLTLRDNYFDFIHIRSLDGCVGNWPALYDEIKRILKPGGWLEHEEMLGASLDAPHWRAWDNLCRRFGDTTGMQFGIASSLEGWMAHSGFQNVRSMDIPLPGLAFTRDIRGRITRIVGAFGQDEGNIETMSRRMLQEAARCNTLYTA